MRIDTLLIFHSLAKVVLAVFLGLLHALARRLFGNWSTSFSTANTQLEYCRSRTTCYSNRPLSNISGGFLALPSPRGTLLGGWKLEEGYRHQPTLGQVQHTVQRAVGDVCGVMVPDSEWGTVNKEGSAQARWRDIVATPQIHARRPGEDSKW